MINLSKKTEKILQFSLKNDQSLQKNKKPSQAFKEITGLTPIELHAVLTKCAWEPAEAYGLLGKENYWDDALQLANINKKLAISTK